MSRKRWVYTEGGQPLSEPLEVDMDWINTSGPCRISEEEVYGHAVATDGTDISTRKRHREYMRANGLAMSSDFTQYWEKAEQKRARMLTGDFDHAQRTQDLVHAFNQLRDRRR